MPSASANAERLSNLSVGYFRIGYWDESKNSWIELPSQIFWNGSDGVVEAETNRGAGRYALLWSYKGDTQLSSLKGEEIRIMIDFTTIQPEVPPFTKNDRTMVPLRVIAESMGAHVNWSSSENRIDIVSHETVSLWIGKTEATKDKQPLFIDVAPEIVDGRTFVPLRFVAEALGAKVTWDERTKTVSILS